MLIKQLLKRFIIIINMLFLLLLLYACTKETESIQFLNKEPEIHIGEVIPLKVAILPDDADDQEVSFTSSNTEVAKVVRYDLYALSEGKALITVQQKGTDYDAWYVNVEYVSPESMQLTEQIKTLGIGRTLKLSVDFSPEYTTDKNVIYESSDTSVLQVHGNTLKAISEGTATITARHSCGLSTQLTLTATPVIPEKIEITTESFLNINSTKPITIVFTPNDVTDKNVIWKSSDESIISIENDIITACNIGTVTITAVHKSGLQAQKEIEVKPIQASSISISSKSNGDIYIDDSLKLAVEVSPSDVTDKSVIWSSSNPEVATVNKGVVKGVYPGTAEITVTTGNGKSDSFNVTVSAPLVDKPSNGYSYNYTKRKREAPFEVKVPQGTEHYYVKLKDDISDKTIISLFLYPGSTSEIKVPFGTYKMYYASGTTWRGIKFLFGTETTYSKADALLTFSLNGHYYNGHTVELIKQVGGNLSTSTSNQNEFAD